MGTHCANTCYLYYPDHYDRATHLHPDYPARHCAIETQSQLASQFITRCHQRMSICSYVHTFFPRVPPCQHNGLPPSFPYPDITGGAWRHLIPIIIIIIPGERVCVGVFAAGMPCAVRHCAGYAYTLSMVPKVYKC